MIIALLRAWMRFFLVEKDEDSEDSYYKELPEVGATEIRGE
jgi:hypothetical protein